jgi:hypothetical protein
MSYKAAVLFAAEKKFYSTGPGIMRVQKSALLNEAATMVLMTKMLIIYLFINHLRDGGIHKCRGRALNTKG